MKTFIQGTVKITENIEDVAAYQDAHKAEIQNMLDFADQAGFELSFQTKDNSLVADYMIVDENYTFCKKTFTEMKSKIREKWSMFEMLELSSGDYQ